MGKGNVLMATKRRAKIKVCRSQDGQFYLAVVAGNGEPFVNGETYTRRADALRAANRVQPMIASAVIVDETVMP